MNYPRSIARIALATLLIAGEVGLFPLLANAGALTSVSDTMSRQKASTASSHTIRFTTPTAINDSGGTNTIAIVFPSDFNFTSIVTGDVTFTHGSSTGSENTETLASSPSASAWGLAFSGTQNRTMTFTTPTDGVGAASLATSDKVIITIASTHSTNASTTGSKTITITTATGSGNSGSDTASIAVAIVAGSAADDQVVITATVDPTLTFTNDDATVGFGTLVTANARYATGNTSGSGTDSTAHTLTIATNATSGYTLTYSGATLTDTAAHTIPVATITSDADGTPGTSQFAIDGALTGSGSMASGYDHAGPDWKFTAGATTTLASHTSAVSGDSIAMHYLSNISSVQAAGSYSSTITYIATANF